MPFVRVPLILIAALLAFGSSACSEGRDQADGDATLVIATNSILGDVVENVTGEDAALEVLIPAGTDPHAFEASAREASRLRDADLIVANGLRLEPSVDQLLEDVETSGVKVLWVAEEVDPLPFDDGDDGLGLDPHFWTDPTRVAKAVGLIASALEEIDASVDWDASAQAYAARLEALDQEITEILGPVAPDDRKLVTNHEVFGYFANRYGFTVVGVVIPGGSTLAEPSGRELADLAEVIRAQDVPAIFGEATQPAKLADALRREAGIEADVVRLFTESLGPEGSGAETYIDMMRTDAERIAQALA